MLFTEPKLRATEKQKPMLKMRTLTLLYEYVWYAAHRQAETRTKQRSVPRIHTNSSRLPQRDASNIPNAGERKRQIAVSPKRSKCGVCWMPAENVHSCLTARTVNIVVELKTNIVKFIFKLIFLRKKNPSLINSNSHFFLARKNWFSWNNRDFLPKFETKF